MGLFMVENRQMPSVIVQLMGQTAAGRKNRGHLVCRIPHCLFNATLVKTDSSENNCHRPPSFFFAAACGFALSST